MAKPDYLWVSRIGETAVQHDSKYNGKPVPYRVWIEANGRTGGDYSFGLFMSYLNMVKLRDALTAMIENEKRSGNVWLEAKILSLGIPAGVIWC